MPVDERRTRVALCEGTRLLTTPFDAADYPCPVDLSLGDLRTDTSDDLPTRVERNTDFAAVRRLGPAVHGAFVVVSVINFCNREGQYNGCVDNDSLPAYVWTSAPSVTWAHEFGHVQGLPEIDNCPVQNGAAPIMTSGCIMGTQRHRVTQGECRRFRALRPERERAAVASGVIEAANGECN